MAMTEDTKLACNRLPFKSDATCDRGDVDTQAFVDFPICKLEDPTPADIAIPQVDFPVIPFTPPPCACVDIDFSLDKQVIEDRDDIEMKAVFKSIGDCCEGNYETKFDIKVPCMPFDIEGGSSDVPIDIDIKENCDDTKASGTFNLGIKAEDCTISFNPKLTLTLPRQKDLEFETACSFRECTCEEDPGGSFTVESTTEGCTRTIKHKLSVKFPHVANITACDTANSKAVDMEGELGGSGTLKLGATEDSCGFVTCICPSLSLNLPCPVKGEDIDLKAKIGWGNNTSASTTLATIGVEDCSITCASGDIDLQIPCPLDGKELKLGATIKWDKNGEDPTSDEADLLTTKNDSGDCELTCASDPSIDLKLPCPINGGIVLQSKYTWTTNKTATNNITLAEAKDGESCELIGKIPQLDLKIECPTNNTDATVAVDLQWAGGVHPAKQDTKVVELINEDGICGVYGNDAVINLELPCPLGDNDNITLGATTKWGGAGGGAPAVTLATNKNNKGDCTLKAHQTNLNLSIPCPIKGGSLSLKAIKGWTDFSGTTVSKMIHLVRGANSAASGSDSEEEFEGTCLLELDSSDSHVFDLRMPCPVRGKKVTVNYWKGWKDKRHKLTEKKLAHTEEHDCLITLDSSSTVGSDILMPCPVTGTSIKLHVKKGWTGHSTEFSETLASIYDDDDEEANTVFIDGKGTKTLDLRLDCPVLTSNNKGIKLIVHRVQSTGTTSEEIDLATIASDDCKLTALQPDLWLFEDGSGGGGGGGYPGCFEISIAGQSASFSNPYYRVGGKTYTASGTVSIEGGGILCLIVSAAYDTTPQSSYHVYSDMTALQNAEKDLTEFVCPLYTIQSGVVICDWRKGAPVIMTEF